MDTPVLYCTRRRYIRQSAVLNIVLCLCTMLNLPNESPQVCIFVMVCDECPLIA